MKEIDESKFKVVEGIESTWHYHLRRVDQRVSESLCGAQVFSTEIPVSAWGVVTHLRERYCSKCAEEAKKHKD